jgi:hypothetical protein
MNHATRRIDADTMQAAQSEGITSAQRILKSVPMTSDPLLLHRVDTSAIDRSECVQVAGDPYSSCDAHFNQVEFYQDIERLKREGQAAAFIALLLVALILGTAFYSVLP